MLRHKVQMVHQTHRCFEPRMDDAASKNCVVQLLRFAHQLGARASELGHNLIDRPPVVLRLKGLPIAQISNGKLRCSRQVIIDPRHPQRLEVQQVPGVFLRRPLFIPVRPPHQNVATSAAYDLFQSCWRPSQTRTQVRVLFHREREFKPSFKPNRRLIHGCGQSIQAFLNECLPTRFQSKRKRCKFVEHS